ncbi:hypothetical protein QBC34DRAFT_184425 [Podospora aff. communis PSN243]|uniref:Uncharacterized protein n=1 Tax=Podospora aff. communis PSN243 TaxID=3040156 RepID=A0AAV9GAM0_9PEZI|nr:hypothetical protein QBC34DRAFT_184425 [Podospora aff. communis PSN243]
MKQSSPQHDWNQTPAMTPSDTERHTSDGAVQGDTGTALGREGRPSMELGENTLPTKTQEERCRDVVQPRNSQTQAERSSPQLKELDPNNVPQPTYFGNDEKTDHLRCPEDKSTSHTAAASSQPSTSVSTSLLHPHSRSRWIRALLQTADLLSLLYIYTFTLVFVNNRKRPNSTWTTRLPLMQHLPQSYLHPDLPLNILQTTTWALILIFNKLRGGARYGLYCGRVFAVICLLLGLFFGLDTFIDAAMISSFLNLVVAKAIDLVIERRNPPAGVVSSVSEEDLNKAC